MKPVSYQGVWCRKVSDSLVFARERIAGSLTELPPPPMQNVRVVLIALITGMRIAEIFALKWSDVLQ